MDLNYLSLAYLNIIMLFEFQMKKQISTNGVENFALFVRCIRREGDLESSDTLIGKAGKIEPSDLSLPLPLNGRGQAETNETLRVKGHPRILPATAQVAFQQADFAGWNLWAAINGRPLFPFRFQNLGEKMTLGRNAAAISPSFIEGLTLEGQIGHTARKLAYLLRKNKQKAYYGVMMRKRSPLGKGGRFSTGVRKSRCGGALSEDDGHWICEFMRKLTGDQ
ncbi:hypothetical protein K1719_044794 [Acacia pycnantha]|nr:hypothetical protein K1719_044794 [Acacia pycnantha]